LIETVIGHLLKPELLELIEKRDFGQLRKILCDFPAPDVAEIFTDLKPGDEAVLLRILPRQLAAEVFEHLSLQDQEELVQALGNEQVAQILNDLSPDDRTALLEELPAAVTQKLLNLLSPQERKIAADLLGYPKDSIGRRMTPEYVAIQQNWTVNDVLAHLRKAGRDRETFNQLYVVDDKSRLVDSVRLRNLVVAELNTPVVELLDHQPLALRATEDQETAVAAFKKYDRTILPVVDSNDVLVGVITVDDVLDVAEQEATEDIQKMGGMEALDAPYLKIGLLSMIRKRAGWLAILFVGEMLTATAMGYFQDEIAKAVVLALFVPLIISSGGNSGSQATSLIIRALAVRDITLVDWWRVVRREFVAGIALGCVLAAIALVRILLWPRREQVYGPHYVLVAATVACSLVGVVLFGSLAGSMLPFVLRRLGFDPAAASAPFVATLVDVTGLIIYFTIAYQILHGTLL
jgi:magnesium transporter